MKYADRHYERVHRPVMLDEVLKVLNPSRGGLFVDATLGIGGHAEGILQTSPAASVIGIDQDDEAIALASERLRKFGDRITILKGNFSAIKSLVADRSGGVDGILADLGVSSLQLDSAERGFSFRFDSPLDMRMDPSSENATAAELLATINRDELADLVYQYGEERASRKIARWIVEDRERGEPIKTTFQLANLVRRAVPKKPNDKIDPATRTFQALRIAVNQELGILEPFIADAVDILRPNGVIAVLTFHSLEDRIVKHAFQRLAGKCQCPPRIPQCVCGKMKTVEIITRKPLTATEEESSANPRARSAKLRACRKNLVSPV